MRFQPSVRSAAFAGVWSGVGAGLLPERALRLFQVGPTLGDGGPSLLFMLLFFVGPLFLFVFGRRPESYTASLGQEFKFQGESMKRGIVWFLVFGAIFMLSSLPNELKQ